MAISLPPAKSYPINHLMHHCLTEPTERLSPSFESAQGLKRTEAEKLMRSDSSSTVRMQFHPASQEIN